jgi:hypothetical protein
LTHISFACHKQVGVAVPFVTSLSVTMPQSSDKSSALVFWFLSLWFSAVSTGKFQDMKNVFFWDVALCRYCVNRRFEGTYRLHLQTADWQPPVHAGSSLADFSTLKMESIRSSRTSVYTISTRPHIPKDGILHSHHREDLISYKFQNST